VLRKITHGYCLLTGAMGVGGEGTYKLASTKKVNLVNRENRVGTIKRRHLPSTSRFTRVKY
jgi:hypothetical protein